MSFFDFFKIGTSKNSIDTETRSIQENLNSEEDLSLFNYADSQAEGEEQYLYDSFTLNNVQSNNTNEIANIEPDKNLIANIQSDAVITFGDGLTVNVSDYINQLLSQPVGFETEEEYQQYILEKLSANLEEMKSTYEAQEESDGFFSDLYDGAKKLFGFGTSSKDVEESINKYEEMINGLTQAMNGKGGMTFAQAYEYYTGTSFSADKIDEYMNTSNLYSAMMIGLQYDDEYLEKFEAAAGISAEEFMKEYAQCQLDTFGESSEVKSIADAYSQDQQTYSDRLSNIISTAGLACTVVGAVTTLFCPPAGIALMNAGKGIALTGMFIDNAIDLVDDATDKDGLTKEELGNIALETGVEAISYTAGRTIGKFTNGLNSIVSNKAASAGIGKIGSYIAGQTAETLADTALSLGADYAIAQGQSLITTGEFMESEEYWSLDRFLGEGKNQLIGILTGLSSAKISAYQQGIITTAQSKISSGDIEGARTYLSESGMKMNEASFENFVKSVQEVDAQLQLPAPEAQKAIEGSETEGLRIETTIQGRTLEPFITDTGGIDPAKFFESPDIAEAKSTYETKISDIHSRLSETIDIEQYRQLAQSYPQLAKYIQEFDAAQGSTETQIEKLFTVANYAEQKGLLVDETTIKSINGLMSELKTSQIDYSSRLSDTIVTSVSGLINKDIPDINSVISQIATKYNITQEQASVVIESLTRFSGYSDFKQLREQIGDATFIIPDATGVSQATAYIFNKLKLDVSMRSVTDYSVVNEENFSGKNYVIITDSSESLGDFEFPPNVKVINVGNMKEGCNIFTSYDADSISSAFDKLWSANNGNIDQIIGNIDSPSTEPLTARFSPMAEASSDEFKKAILEIVENRNLSSDEIEAMISAQLKAITVQTDADVLQRLKDTQASILSYCERNNIDPETVAYFVPAQSVDQAVKSQHLLAYRMQLSDPNAKIIEINRKLEASQIDPSVKYLVYIDDFAGTGNSLKTVLSQAASAIGSDRKIIIAPLIATEEAIKNMEITVNQGFRDTAILHSEATQIVSNDSKGVFPYKSGSSIDKNVFEINPKKAKNDAVTRLKECFAPESKIPDIDDLRELFPSDSPEQTKLTEIYEKINQYINSGSMQNAEKQQLVENIKSEITVLRDNSTNGKLKGKLQTLLLEINGLQNKFSSVQYVMIAEKDFTKLNDYEALIEQYKKETGVQLYLYKTTQTSVKGSSTVNYFLSDIKPAIAELTITGYDGSATGLLMPYMGPNNNISLINQLYRSLLGENSQIVKHNDCKTELYVFPNQEE